MTAHGATSRLRLRPRAAIRYRAESVRNHLPQSQLPGRGGCAVAGQLGQT